MRIRVFVHKAEEGGFWAEVPSIPGCATQGETMEEIEANVREAIEGCLSAEVEEPLLQLDDQVIELAQSGGRWHVLANQRSLTVAAL